MAKASQLLIPEDPKLTRARVKYRMSKAHQALPIPVSPARLGFFEPGATRHSYSERCVFVYGTPGAGKSWARACLPWNPTTRVFDTDNFANGTNECGGTWFQAALALATPILLQVKNPAVRMVVLSNEWGLLPLARALGWYIIAFEPTYPHFRKLMAGRYSRPEEFSTAWPSFKAGYRMTQRHSYLAHWAHQILPLDKFCPHMGHELPRLLPQHITNTDNQKGN